MSQEFLGAVTLLLYGVLKAFGIQLENGVLEGILTGLVALYVAFRRHAKGDISVLGVRKA